MNPQTKSIDLKTSSIKDFFSFTIPQVVSVPNDPFIRPFVNLGSIHTTIPDKYTLSVIIYRQTTPQVCEAKKDMFIFDSRGRTEFDLVISFALPFNFRNGSRYVFLARLFDEQGKVKGMVQSNAFNICLEEMSPEIKFPETNEALDIESSFQLLCGEGLFSL